MTDYKYEEISNYFNDFIKERPDEWIKDNLDDLHYHAFNSVSLKLARATPRSNDSTSGLQYWRVIKTLEDIVQKFIVSI